MVLIIKTFHRKTRKYTTMNKQIENYSLGVEELVKRISEQLRINSISQSQVELLTSLI